MPHPNRGHEVISGGGWNGAIWHYPEITARIAEWHRSGLVEVQWLTSWEDEADDFLAEPLGLPRGLTTHRRASVSTEENGGWWKEAVVRRVLSETDQLVVWCDDEMVGDEGQRGDAIALDHPDRVLCICPDYSKGMTGEDLDLIERWLTVRHPSDGGLSGPVARLRHRKGSL